LKVLEGFLSSKMGRGVLAAAGGSGGNPFLIPKPFTNSQKKLWKSFLKVFELFGSRWRVFGKFFKSF